MAEGIKIFVYDAADLTEPLDIIARRWEPSLLEEHNRDGGGSFKIRIDDPALIANPTLLDDGRIARVQIDGIFRVAFEIKRRTIQIVPTGEYSGEWLEVSGPGLLDWFTHATVLPERGITQAVDDRVFNFTSKAGTWYQPSEWTNAVKREALHANGNPHPLEWPKALTADWIWSQTGNAPVGDVYIRREFTTVADANYRLVGTPDDFAAVYIDGVRVLTMTEHDSLMKTHAQDLELAAGDHVMAIKVRNTGGPGGIVLALCAVPNNKNNEDLKDSERILWTGDDLTKWKVRAYPATPPGWTLGQTLLTLLTEAQGRNVNSMQRIIPNFSATVDSNGNAWAETYDLSIPVGDSYRSVIERLTDSYCDIWVDPDFKLNVVPVRGVDRSTGNDPVTFRRGMNVLSAESAVTAEIANAAFVKTNTGMVETAGPAESISKYGRREAYISADADASSTVTAALIEQLFDKFAQPRTTPTLSIFADDGYEPWVDFGVGDWILAPSDADPAKLVKRRIVSISASEDPENGEPIYSCEIDTIQETYEERVARWISSIENTGKAGGLTGTGTSSSAGGDLPSPGSGHSTPPIGHTPDQRQPTAPTGVSASPDIVTVAGARPLGKVLLTWAHNGKATDGTDITVDSFEAWVKEVGATYNYYLLGGTTGMDTQMYAEGLRIKSSSGTAIQYQVVIRAKSEAGPLSDFSPAVTFTMVDDTAAPLKPSTPTVTAKGTVFTVKSDGKDLNNAAAAADYDYTIVESSATSGGTYVQVGTIYGAGEFATGGFGYATRWFRVKHVDRSGNVSAPSTAASAQSVPLVDADIILSAIDAAVTQISNIGSAAISTGAILEDKLAANAVSQAKLKDGAVSLLKLDTATNDKITKGINDAATAQTKANLADTNAGKAQAAADAALLEAKKNNLILNGDLEDPLSTYGSAYRVPLASAHSGGYGAGLLSDVWRTIYWNIVPVIQGQLLEARCWVKDDGDTGNCKVSFAFDKYGPDGVELTGDLYPATIISDPLPTGTWQEAVVRFAPIPAGVSFVRLRTTSSGTVWGTAKVYIDDVWMGDVAAMAAAEAAQAKADQAFSDAAGALTAAGNAQDSANGKNNVYYLAALPAGTGFADGDTTFIRSAEGQPYTAQYKWEKTGPTTGSWKIQTMSHQVIASVDLGKATVGELDGIYIKGKSIDADKLLVGRGANIYSDESIADLAYYVSNSYTFTTGGKTGKGSIYMSQADAVQRGTYYATADSVPAKARRTRVMGGQSYRVGAWIKTSAAAPINTIRLIARLYRDSDNTYIFPAVSSIYNDGLAGRPGIMPVNTWVWVSGIISVPADTEYTGMSLGFYKEIGYSTGTTRFSDPSIQQMMTGELVVDGTVTAGKMYIAGDPNNPDEVDLSANFAKLIKLEVSNLIATTGNMEEATITTLWNEVVNSQKITTDMLVVGMGENMIVDPYLKDTKTNNLKTANAGAGWSWISGGTAGNVYRHSHQGTGSPWVEMAPDWIDVEPGKTYRFAYSMGGVSVVGNTPSLQATYAGRRADGTTTYLTWPGSAAGTNASGWVTIEQELTVPSDIIQIKPRVRGNSSGVGIVYVRFSHLALKMDASMIVNGAVAAQHITASESMWAKVLGAHLVKALEIDTNDLSSDTGFVADMRTTILTTDWVKAINIDATNGITSRHTLTGPTIQTSATALRGVKISTTGIKAYDAGSVNTFSLDATTGNMVATGTMQTSPSGSRVLLWDRGDGTAAVDLYTDATGKHGSLYTQPHATNGLYVTNLMHYTGNPISTSNWTSRVTLFEDETWAIGQRTKQCTITGDATGSLHFQGKMVKNLSTALETFVIGSTVVSQAATGTYALTYGAPVPSGTRLVLATADASWYVQSATQSATASGFSWIWSTAANSSCSMRFWCVWTN